MPKLIHISRQRYDFILSQSYNLGSYPAVRTYYEGDTNYHLLDDEYAFCETCRTPFDSVDANSPAELETIKACPERATIALRDMRQEMMVRYKELCLKDVA